MENKTFLLLYKAIENGDLTTVSKTIGESPGLVHEMTPFGTWLHIASSRGKLEIVKWLIARGADPNAKGGTLGGSALREAASDGQIEVVNYLLDNGAEVDTSEPERNPLWGAIYYGSLELVKLLIARGVDHRIKYYGSIMNGMDAIAFAHERGQRAIEKYLRSLDS